MADLPILFSTPMVRAILREIEQPGTGKTQTRRLLTGDCDEPTAFIRDGAVTAYDEHDCAYRWPRTKAVGDRLWVRERATRFDKGTCDQHIWFHAGRNEIYPWLDKNFPGLDADAPWPHQEGPGGGAPYSIPSIHMPRWASRITLIVTDVRVQRLQDISEADAIAEGVSAADVRMYPELGTARMRFHDIWNHINNARGYGWEANPWVAAYTFRPILGNIDQVACDA